MRHPGRISAASRLHLGRSLLLDERHGEAKQAPSIYDLERAKEAAAAEAEAKEAAEAGAEAREAAEAGAAEAAAAGEAAEGEAAADAEAEQPAKRARLE